MGDDRNLDPEQRGDRARADARPIALVGRVHDERDARGDQLRARGLDLDRAVAVRPVEADPVVRTVDLAVLDLGLCHRRLEVDVPHRGRVGLVGEPVPDEVKEPPL